MTATPTPGDLSARLQKLSDACLSRRLTPAECGEFHDCIAALSALPAGGGEVCQFFASGPEGNFFTNDSVEADRLIARAGFDRDEWTVTELTTPQPSAAEKGGFPKCGCGRPGEYESKDGPACNKYFRCKDAAVGAQGDGTRTIVSCQCHTDEQRRLCLYKSGCVLIETHAAPAAGKGVDDAMRQWAQGLIEQLPGDHDGRNSWMLNHGVGEESDWLRTEHARYSQAWKDWRTGYPQPERKPNPFRNATESGYAALTRQPVAGDGMVLVPREPSPEQVRAGTLTGILTPNQASAAYQAMLAAAPAATPTDGGEGKS